MNSVITTLSNAPKTSDFQFDSFYQKYKDDIDGLYVVSDKENPLVASDSEAYKDGIYFIVRTDRIDDDAFRQELCVDLWHGVHSFVNVYFTTNTDTSLPTDNPDYVRWAAQKSIRCLFQKPVSASPLIASAGEAYKERSVNGIQD